MQGNRLRAEMERQKVSYRELEFLTGYNAGYLCRLAAGKRAPSKDAALRIARALKAAPARVWPDLSERAGAA